MFPAPRFAGRTKLVFAGGGVRGLAYIGAIEAIEATHPRFLAEVTCAAGASIGALFALLVVLGYSVAEIRAAAFDTDFAVFLANDGDIDVVNLFTSFGLSRGTQMTRRVAALIAAKGFAEDIAFAALSAQTGRDLVVLATCVDTQSVEHFDADASPDLSVTAALRMSMSVPLLFTAPLHNGRYYTDAGVLNNYPIDLHDPADASVLGFRLSPEVSHSPQKIYDIQSFLTNVVYCTLTDLEHCRSEHAVTPTNTLSIPFPDSAPGSFQVEISDTDKNLLVRCGFLAVLRL